MNTFIVFSISIFLVTFIVFVTFSILTLLQIKRTAKEIEIVMKRINQQLESVNNITSKIISIVPVGISILSSIFGSITGLLKRFSFRRLK